MAIENSTVPQDDGRPSSTSGWLSVLKSKLGLPGSPNLRDTIEEALQADRGAETAFSVEEREILLRLLRYGTLKVEDVMVPRADIIAVEEAETVAEVLQTFVEAGVSRVPLYHETLDDPRGMLHVKDLLTWMVTSSTKSTAGAVAAGAYLDADVMAKPISAAKVRRPVLFVPPSMPAMNLLIRMQSTRIHMALVVDEYGGTDGLVTIEDLVEEIVGEIEDEHDEEEAANITIDPVAGMTASARTPVDELELQLGVPLMKPDEMDVDTLGGLVFSLVGRVPARGELVPHPSGVEFEVLDADARRIKKLKVHPPVQHVPETEPSVAAVEGGKA